jgi:hypothetical protein
MLFTDDMLTEIPRTLAVVYMYKNSTPQKQNFKPISKNRKNHQIISSNPDDLLVLDLSCYNCGDWQNTKLRNSLVTIGELQCMVETACENNDERVESDFDTIDLLRKVWWLQF